MVFSGGLSIETFSETEDIHFLLRGSFKGFVSICQSLLGEKGFHVSSCGNVLLEMTECN